ncbi:hypothetical protein L1887_29335 [Cichorium endivia]|nr:hypothetical protein L1887_29335 [Cichorium endivia]
MICTSIASKLELPHDLRFSTYATSTMNPSRPQQHHHVAAAGASLQRCFVRSLKDAYSGGSEDRTIDAIIGLRFLSLSTYTQMHPKF